MNKDNYLSVKNSLPDNVKLIAVSKTKPAAEIMELYEAGQLHFGENKAQELKAKYEILPKDIEWHFIGHLQTNKIKYILPFVKLIHSIDSYKLLKEVDKQAVKTNRIIPCLLQFFIATEETKFGFTLDECEEMLNDAPFKSLQNIEIQGVMGMATFTDNQAQIRNEFKNLRRYFEILKDRYFKNQQSFKEISMGMTDDYLLAIQEGSTMVRIGSAIFGERNYTDAQ